MGEIALLKDEVYDLHCDRNWITTFKTGYFIDIKNKSTNNIMNTNKAAAIEPWLTISNGQQALAFYKSAFGAVETYRLENPDGGFVVRLSIYNAGFWISSEADSDDKDHQALGGDNLRLVLVVDDPDTLFAQAIEAGATEIFPVGEEHGWRLGRLSDPFGLHWEIGHMLAQ